MASRVVLLPILHCEWLTSYPPQPNRFRSPIRLFLVPCSPSWSSQAVTPSRDSVVTDKMIPCDLARSRQICEFWELKDRAARGEERPTLTSHLASSQAASLCGGLGQEGGAHSALASPALAWGTAIISPLALIPLPVFPWYLVRPGCWALWGEQL